MNKESIKNILSIILIIFLLSTIIYCFKIIMISDGTEEVSRIEVHNITLSGSRSGLWYMVDNYQIPPFRMQVIYNDNINTPELVINEDYNIIPFIGKVFNKNDGYGAIAGSHYVLILPTGYRIN